MPGARNTATSKRGAHRATILESVADTLSEGTVIVGRIIDRVAPGASVPEPAPKGEAKPPEAPPPPAESDLERVVRARAILRFSAFARQWQRAEPDRQADFLLKGKALAEASLYVDDDPLIRAHVEASEAQEAAARDDNLRQYRRQMQIVTGLFGLALLFLASALVLVYQVRTKNSELIELNRVLELKKSEAEKQKLAAEEALEQMKKAQLEERAARAVAESEKRKSVAVLETLADVTTREPGIVTRNDALAKREAVITSNRDMVSRPQPRSLNPDLKEPGDIILPSPGPRIGLPGAAQPKAPGNVIASAEPPRPSVIPTGASIGTCTGYLWFGSAGASRLANGRDPSTLKAGERVNISQDDDIRLRERPPSPEYGMAAQIGLVPAGASVNVVGPAQIFPRPSGPQVWAQIAVPRTYCSSVFVQYQGDAGRLPELRALLHGVGVQVPPEEQVAGAAGKSEIRFYWAEDEAVARLVAAALAPLGAGRKPLQLTPLTDFPARAKPKPTTIEVWLDLD